MLENQPLKNVIGNTTDAPYINSIAEKCSYSTNTHALSDTSLTNYIALTSGYTGCDMADANRVCTHESPIPTNRGPSTWPQASKSIFELMNSTDTPRADSAVQWAESMPDRCYQESVDAFLVQHAPYQYYTHAQGTCPQYAKPFPAVPPRVLSAKFNLVIPNRVHIMHRPLAPGPRRIRDGDKWLRNFLPALLDSRRYQGGESAILITWDEGNEWDDTLPLIVITPYTTQGGVSDVYYDHYSTLKGIQLMLGQTTLLGHSADPGHSNIRHDTVFRLR